MKTVPLFFLLFFSSLFAKNPDVYQSISDIRHPKRKDWVLLQEFLSHGEREELKWMQEAIDPGGTLYNYDSRMRKFRLAHKHFWVHPEFKKEAINCEESQKECCIVTYASYNNHYPEAIELLRAQLKKIGYQGHFIYRIGGWPDLEGGSLTLAHVPYAFKPCFLREARRLGYKKVLWLDTSIRPLRDLKEVFSEVEKKGYFFYLSGHFIAPYCTKRAMEWFGLSSDEARKIPSLTAGILGLNFEHPKGNQMLDDWMEAARGEASFFSPRADQNALSIVAYLLEMKEWEPMETLCWQKEKLNEKTRFFIDYGAF